MPINIPDGLPAKEILLKENIFIMDDTKALHQDIRPLRILLVNLTAHTHALENRVLHLLANSPLQLDVTVTALGGGGVPVGDGARLWHAFCQPPAHVMKQRYDGMITYGGADGLLTEEARVATRFRDLLSWSRHSVFSSFHFGWGGVLAINHFHRIPVHPLPHGLSDVMTHILYRPDHQLLYGFDDCYFVPCICRAGLLEQDILDCPELLLLSGSPPRNIGIVANRGGTQFFAPGHSELDRSDDPGERCADATLRKQGAVRWRANLNLVVKNWLNYFVYQNTPYDYIPLYSQ